MNVNYQSRRNIQENDSYNATAFIAAAADPITPIHRDNLVDVPDFMQDRIYNHGLNIPECSTPIK